MLQHVRPSKGVFQASVSADLVFCLHQVRLPIIKTGNYVNTALLLCSKVRNLSLRCLYLLVFLYLNVNLRHLVGLVTLFWGAYRVPFILTTAIFTKLGGNLLIRFEYSRGCCRQDFCLTCKSGLKVRSLFTITIVRGVQWIFRLRL